MTFVGFSLVRLTGFGVVTLFLFWGDGEVSLSVTSSSEVDSLLRMLGRLSFLLSLVSMFLGFWFVTTELILMGSSPFLARGLKVKLSVICVVVSPSQVSSFGLSWLSSVKNNRFLHLLFIYMEINSSYYSVADVITTCEVSYTFLNNQWHCFKTFFYIYSRSEKKEIIWNNSKTGLLTKVIIFPKRRLFQPFPNFFCVCLF